MPPELWILGFVFILIALVGVPAIKRGVHLPREMILETIGDEDLTDTQRTYFQRLDAEVATLGYTPLLNFIARNLQGANVTRVYRSDYDAAVLGASCLKGRSAVDESESSQNYLEWVTKYEDGTSLTTRNVTIAELFARMPHQLLHDYPGMASAALKARHDRHAEPLRVRGPRFPHGRDVLQEFRDYHRRWCTFQDSKGLLRFDAQADVYRATGKVAWRGVANFLNPLADNFTLPRFVAGVLLGAGVPALAAATAQGLPMLFAAFVVAGAAIGWLFTSKSFVWALLLGYVPLRVAVVGTGTALLLILTMGLVADRVARYRFRREMVAE